jgi:glycerophosphoryl diester phosphodiesterase
MKFDVAAHAYAHRGLWGGDDSPENSLIAFRAASVYEVGAELDVRLTADGHPVVFHDATLQRLCNHPARIADLTLRDLRVIPLPDGSPIPTLAEALTEMDGQPVLIELKVDAPEAGADLAEAVAAVLRDADGPFAAPCAAMSFHAPTVARLRQLIANRPIGMLIEPAAQAGRDAVLARLRHAADIGCDYLAPHHTSLETVAAHAPGSPLVSWTIAEPDQLALARRFNAAPIFENMTPSRARGVPPPPQGA